MFKKCVNWFLGRNIPCIFIIVGSTLDPLLWLYWCMSKGCRTSTLLSAIHAIPKSQAFETSVDPSVNIRVSSMFEQALANVVIFLCIAILVCILVKIFNLANKQYFKFEIQPDQNYQGYLAEIYVELFDNVDYVKLQICSVEHHSSNIKLSRHTNIKIGHYTKGFMCDSLLLDYNGCLVVCKSSNSNFGLPVYVSVPISCKFTVRRMIKRNCHLDFIKTRLIASSNGMAYDLLRNVHKTTYALNVECQTDANITIEPESENVVYEDMSLCNS